MSKLIFIFPVALLVVGVLNFIFPEAGYLYRRRWMFKDKPLLTKGAVIMLRITSIIIIVVGIMVFITITQIYNYLH